MKMKSDWTMTLPAMQQADFITSNISGILKPMLDQSPAHLLPMDSVIDNFDLMGMLVAVAGKDKHAFESLYNATVDRLFGLALRITEAHDLAEDVLSDVYLQVWRDAHNYSVERGSVMAWLSIICRSRSLDKLRKQQQFAAKEEAFVNQQPEASEQIALDFLSALEQDSALHKALLVLDDTSRQLLALAYFKDYSHTELAQVTGKPIGTVKTLIRRAIIKLNEVMLKTADSSGAIYE